MFQDTWNRLTWKVIIDLKAVKATGDRAYKTCSNTVPIFNRDGDVYCSKKKPTEKSYHGEFLLRGYNLPAFEIRRTVINTF